MSRDVFENTVRYIRHSPRLAFSLQIIQWILRALFLLNITRSVFPLVRPRSRPLTNIPLTPAQRDLIGLDKTGRRLDKSHVDIRHNSYRYVFD
jgi:hypothetical protein